ncbi:MAG: hypothetical protein JXR94_14195 [Candidatus Hydrogenedentes bacterium]|nr:hypothetical protein [Candidatus Hydrogenedentota bacterium]
MLVSIVMSILAAGSLDPGTPLGAFAYESTEAAQADWKPQFGTGPVRVEADEDGAPCLVCEATFTKNRDRACWDWMAPLDLSKAGHVKFDIAAEPGGFDVTFGVYFGTPNGWYASTWAAAPGDSWQTRSLALGRLGTEGTPDGWDKVDKFRFSVWGSAPGKVVYRLRNLRVIDADPAENLFQNGSFEIDGVGIPYGWSSNHWGVGDMPWFADMDLWRAHWALDRTVAKHGKQSIRIINTPELPILQARSLWVRSMEEGKDYVLSAWLRADREGLPVKLLFGGAEAQAAVGTEWTQAVLRGIKASPRPLLSIVPQAPGTLWIDAVQLQALAEPTPEFHLHFRDEELALREAGVDWTPPARTQAVAQGRTISGPVAAATTGIDEHGRFLLDGRPYIQHSFGIEFVSDLAVLDAVARAGFKDICIQIRETLTTDELEAIFDRCAEAGLRVIPWLDGRMTRERFTEHITRLKAHPALLCWYVYDEPSGERFAEADARIQMAHELDPAHPAYVNYLASKLTDHTGDIYSTDVYPIPHSSPMAAIGAVRTMKAAAVKENKPVWMWLQSTGYAYGIAREPSPRELSCMVYGSLIEGARGIYYFAQMPRTKECFDEMRAMCIEVDALTPALYSLDAAPEARCDADGFLCRAYRDGDAVTVLAVNTQNRRERVRIAVPTPSASAEAVFEGRSVPVADGAWEDDFGAYERHVYRVKAE